MSIIFLYTTEGISAQWGIFLKSLGPFREELLYLNAGLFEDLKAFLRAVGVGVVELFEAFFIDHAFCAIGTGLVGDKSGFWKSISLIGF